METQELIENLEELSKCQMFEMILRLQEKINEMAEKLNKLEDLGYFQS